MKDFFESLKLSTKVTLISGLFLLIFGYLVRIVDISFFWESKWIGFVIISIAFILLFIDRIEYGKSRNLKTIWNKIGIGVIAFILVIRTILFIIIPTTTACEIAKEHVKNNAEIIDEVGEIKRISIVPTGGIQVTSDSSGEYGSATIVLILEGSKKYKDVTVFVNKYPDTEWKVEGTL